MKVLYEDDDIIVCHKPSAVATQTSKVGEKDMVSELKNYLCTKNQDLKSRGDVYVGLIHRLDQGVEGILVFAKTPWSAAELSRQITEHTMKKYYYAVVYGEIMQQEGTLTDYLIKNGRDNTSKVVSKGTPGAKPAELRYSLIGSNESEGKHLVRIELITGRHHQIRVQFAHRGMPLVNDYKYGYSGDRDEACKGIALCAYRLSLMHPKTHREMNFEIEPTAEIFRKITV